MGATTAPRTRQRIQVIDIARALAVLGVVLNHTVGGLLRADLVEFSSPLGTVNYWLYMFRMPALALLLGLFIPGGVQRHDSGGYIRRRLVFSFYVFVIWQVIISLAEVASSGVSNSGRGVADVLQVWDVQTPLWFLPYLAVATVVITALAPWRSSRWAAVTVLVTGGAGVLLWGWSSSLIGLRGLALLMFTGAGAVLGLRRFTRLLASRWWYAAPLALGLVAAGTALIDTVPPTLDVSELYGPDAGLSLMQRFASFAVSVAGVVSLLGLAHWAVLAAPVARLLTWLGRHTLELYVAHVLFTSGTRIALLRLGVDHLGWHVVLGVGAGVLGPVLLVLLTRRLRWEWVFTPPARWVGHPPPPGLARP